jgi:hypothetical protein
MSSGQSRLYRHIHSVIVAGSLTAFALGGQLGLWEKILVTEALLWYGFLEIAAL